MATKTVVATHIRVCPHCGNRDQQTVEDNGADPRDVDFTLLCVARVALGDDAFGGEANPPLEVDANGDVACGMQWCPNDSY
jgi:hypothetical protein